MKGDTGCENEETDQLVGRILYGHDGAFPGAGSGGRSCFRAYQRRGICRACGGGLSRVCFGGSGGLKRPPYLCTRIGSPVPGAWARRADGRREPGLCH
ncbi:hypothetical protein SDC9_190435 [bioreactor metagenome]|uniref:Uncharacterized protein n=1 Tax=bioreactor metagenome TaxID=1076179 RepID=A0A645HV70_9ZZZZ